MELSSLLLSSSALLLIITSIIFSNYFKQQRKPKVDAAAQHSSIENDGGMLHLATALVASSPTYTTVVGNLVYTANPANLEHMFKTNFDNYPKGKRQTTMLHDFLGDGIFNTNDEPWKEQRRIASFEFSTKSLRTFVVDIVHSKISNILIPLLEKASIDGGVLDLQDVFERFAFDTICEFVFGKDNGPMCLAGGDDEGSRFYHAVEEALLLICDRSNHPPTLRSNIQSWLGMGREKKLKQSIQVVHNYIGQRLALLKDGHGLVSRFIDYSEEYLRDIPINFIIAGRDTTPSTLTWLFWILSRRPDIVQSILAEVKSIRDRHGKHDGMLELEQLREMPYLHAVISETLRLYPAVALNMRTCREDDVMPDGTVVRNGWVVMFNAYAMGRMESIWGDDCMEVKPERWLVEGVFKPKNPFQYPAFHAGPRMCLGKEMAYLQMKAVAASIVERFETEPGAECGGEPVFVLSLTMKGGLPMKLKSRR